MESQLHLEPSVGEPARRRLRTPVRIAIELVVIVALGLSLFVTAARNGWMMADDATMRYRYALPDSRFMIIDGMTIHYVDEGYGPAVVLVHGSYGSLRMWADWARVLRHGHRVIRFDRPPMGLSGPSRDGHYDAAREAELIDVLTRRLSLQRFVIVGTSSGGESVAAYAAMHPDRVSGVILANIAPGPPVDRARHYPLAFRLVSWTDSYLGGWHLPSFWRGVLQVNYADPGKVTPALVHEWTDFNNRAQFYPHQPHPAGYVPFARTAGDLAAIHAPALVLWSDRDAELPVESAGRTTLQLLGSADKAIAVIPNCGHMMPLECGPASVAVARNFINRIQSRRQP
jgi:pimeloyl-ACP methyl ester carboxylesterase